jgi:hypothetical protein
MFGDAVIKGLKNENVLTHPDYANPLSSFQIVDRNGDTLTLSAKEYIQAHPEELDNRTALQMEEDLDSAAVRTFYFHGFAINQGQPLWVKDTTNSGSSQFVDCAVERSVK